MSKINYQGKEYFVPNIEKMIQNRDIIPLADYPLNPGDIYKRKDGTSNPLVLVKAVYTGPRDQTTPAYILLGREGFAPNSDDFFLKIHTLDEIRVYLSENRFFFAGNMKDDFCKLRYQYTKQED